MTHYTAKEINDYVRGYYRDLDELYEWCNYEQDQVDWIIAECIFEQESGLY